MARYRTIKPEYWSSTQVMACSRDARLLFIGLWNFCDDTGRHPADPKTIKAKILPGDDDVTLDTIRRLLAELSENDLIQFYEHSSTKYLAVTGWHHQKIDKPQKSKYPAPSENGSDNSPNGRRTLVVREERKGEEGKEDKGASGRAREGETISEDWKPSDTSTAKATELGMTSDEVERMTQRFVPYNRSKGHVSLDWDATFQSWLPDEVRRLGRKKPAVPDPQEVEAQKSRFHVKVDTPQWQAWTKYRGKRPPLDSQFGWWFESEWPPGHEPKEEAA